MAICLIRAGSSIECSLNLIQERKVSARGDSHAEA